MNSGLIPSKYRNSWQRQETNLIESDNCKMNSHNVSKAKAEKSVQFANLSAKGTFYLGDRLFKIVKSKCTSPKAPPFALVNLNTKERVSGLFEVSPNILKGDVRVDGKKAGYFSIKVSSDRSLAVDGADLLMTTDSASEVSSVLGALGLEVEDSGATTEVINQGTA